MIEILHGTVEHGDARGREIGFPTANLRIDDREHLDGVWAGYAEVDDLRHAASISIGRRPTYYPDNAYRLAEIHILDFQGNLYDKVMSVELTTFIRGQQRFNNSRELISQIIEDVRITRELTDPSEKFIRLPWIGLVAA